MVSNYNQKRIRKRNRLWIFTGRTDAEAEAPLLWPPDAESAHWKRPWCWERLRAEVKGGHREWDGWMAWPTDTNLNKLWEIMKDGKPGVLESMESQRVRHDYRLDTITTFSIFQVPVKIPAPWEAQKNTGKDKEKILRNIQVGSGIRQRLDVKFKSQHSLILI